MTIAHMDDLFPEEMDNKKSKKHLKNITEDEFDTLKEMGLLWEFYPEAPEFFRDINKPQIGRCICCGKPVADLIHSTKPDLCSECGDEWI
ncbi:MAG: hypothetical protein M0R03_16985 [Novosphingobium sp.]|nr:hypothetical protein [Novosphingobium sp.]